MTATLIYIIIAMGIISVSGCCYCSYLSFLMMKATKKALPALRDVQRWPEIRERIIQ